MRKNIWFGLLLLISMMALPFVVSAQTSSVGCTALEGTTATNDGSAATVFGPYEFVAGELVSVTVTGGDANTTFDVTIGTFSSADNALDTTVSYEIPEDGTYTVEVTATSTGTVDVTVDGTCAPFVDPDGPVTLCHIPPGNPAASHTITVGAPAVDAHLGHGDILGACPNELQTRYDDFELGFTIFILYDENAIQVFGNCDEGECQEVVATPFSEIVDLSVILVNLDDDAEFEFPEVEDPEEYGFEFDGGDALESSQTIIIYYLHPNPDDDSIGVFQLNIYENGVLADDSLLIFVNADGDIVFWASQNYWASLLD